MSQRKLPATSGVKVKRYFPGKGEEIKDYSSSEEESENEVLVQNKQSKEEENEVGGSKIQIGSISSRPLPVKMPSRAQLSDSDSDNSDEDESDDGHDFRERVKALALQKQRILELQNSTGQLRPSVSSSESEEDSEEEESSSEEESSEEERVVFKPVFIPKTLRTSTLEKEKLAKEAEELEKAKIEEEKARKEESRKAVQDIIRKEIDLAQAAKKLDTEVDDTDGLDPEAEYEEWKLRELMRIKRDKEEREEREREAEELERRRNMTEAERIEEDLKKIEEQQKGKDDRAKPVFMQKYHHKGAFFMDKDESVYKRDAMVPTEGEIRNKEALPKVMQVRNFGMAGQTKYTHLKDQDTTQDSPWNQVGSKKLKQLGGLHNYHDEQRNIRDAKRRKKDDE